jgi:hypothetical protein
MRNPLHVAFLAAFLFAFLSSADEEKKEADGRIGPNFAVMAFNKEDGFKLSDQAQKTLAIGFSSVEGPGPWKISKDSLVTLKKSTGVYRRYKGFITMVLVDVASRNDKSLTITSEDLEAGDEIATNGAPFLRMIDADLNSETSDGCAH